MLTAHQVAPELPTNLTWLNSPPLALKSLKNKVILLDFWTYSCINCQRTLPILRSWWDKYKDHGLVIIGIHSPEFEFESDPENVKEALEKYRVTWPIVLDNNFKIWQTYDNQYWPTEYLVDHQGKISSIHVGEGECLETEAHIRQSLEKAGFKITSEPEQFISEPLGHYQTPELYLGYNRGILGNPKGYYKDHPFLYQSPDQIEPDFIYLQGIWEAKPEYIEHTKQTEELEDVITLSYQATKVFLVMESASEKPIKVYVTLDENNLAESDAGVDINFDKENRSFINVQFSTLYNIIDTKTFGSHIVKISTLEKGLRCFAFTFGS